MAIQTGVVDPYWRYRRIDRWADQISDFGRQMQDRRERREKQWYADAAAILDMATKFPEAMEPDSAFALGAFDKLSKFNPELAESMRVVYQGVTGKAQDREEALGRLQSIMETTPEPQEVPIPSPMGGFFPGQARYTPPPPTINEALSTMPFAQRQGALEAMNVPRGQMAGMMGLFDPGQLPAGTYGQHFRRYLDPRTQTALDYSTKIRRTPQELARSAEVAVSQDISERQADLARRRLELRERELEARRDGGGKKDKIGSLGSLEDDYKRWAGADGHGWKPAKRSGVRRDIIDLANLYLMAGYSKTDALKQAFFEIQHLHGAESDTITIGE